MHDTAAAHAAFVFVYGIFALHVYCIFRSQKRQTGLRLRPSLLGIMPRKRSGTFKPVCVLQQLCVGGGCLKEPRVVTTKNIGGEEYVEVGKQIDWLCHLITGFSRSSSPLKQCKLFEQLRKQCPGAEDGDGAAAAPAAGGGDDDDPMASFIVSDSAHTQGRKRGREKKPSPVRGCAGGDVVRSVEIALPGGAKVHVQASVGGRPKGRSSVKAGNLFVRADGLAAFICALRQDFNDMGVSEDADDVSEGCDESLCFVHRDRAWVVSYAEEDGSRCQKRFYVPKYEVGTRRYLPVDEYAAERERARERAEEWIQKNLNRDSHA